MTSSILHITTLQRWEESQVDGEYRGDTLATQGFIHCATAEQLDGVVERFFRGQTGLVVLTIDPDKVLPPIRWEHAPDANELFPHIYGPLNVDAVTGVAPLSPG